METKPKNKQYVNEHILAILMSSFRNYNGQTIDLDRQSPEQKELRVKFDELKKEYHQALLENNGDKRNARVQTVFRSLIGMSGDMIPTDQEIKELYTMIRDISQRCLRVYGKNRGLDYEDIAISSFERWLKYKHNFNPLKRSETSGVRVNAFSYMTQLIKNTIFEVSNKVKREEQMQQKITEKWKILNESDLNHTALEALSDDEIQSCLTQEATNFSDWYEFLNKTIKKYNLDASVVIEVLEAHKMVPKLYEIINQNKWAF